MNMVSIQGPMARGYYLTDAERMAFTQFLNSVFDNRFLFIHSPFKTDIVYQADRNLNTYLIRHLMEHAKKEITPQSIGKFYTTVGMKDTLENYFLRLNQLTANEEWFDAYVSEFSEKITYNPDNSILRHVLRCLSFINIDNINKLNNLTALHQPLKKLKVSEIDTHTQVVNFLDKFIPN